MRTLYFDYNATTPVAPCVRQAILPHLTNDYGNPGCSHAKGRDAQQAVALGRARLAALLNVPPDTVCFTSGATEADNLAVLGVCGPLAGPHRRRQLALSATEHPAVAAPAAVLARHGATVDTLPVDADGLLELDALADSLQRKPPGLLAIMLANNETGALHPVAEAAALAHAHGWLVHCDAAQAVGKIPVDVPTLGVDFLAVAGHKCHAPKGVGALVVATAAARDAIAPIVYGGGQEGSLRPGTENVAFIAGLGAAAALASGTLEDCGALEAQGLEAEAMRQRALGERLLAGLTTLDRPFTLFGPAMMRPERLPQTANVGFRDLAAGDLLAALNARGVAVSGGAACHAGQGGVSGVLAAMGADPAYARGALRFSWGRGVQEDDVDELLARLESAFASL